MKPLLVLDKLKNSTNCLFLLSHDVVAVPFLIIKLKQSMNRSNIFITAVQNCILCFGVFKVFRKG